MKNTAIQFFSFISIILLAIQCNPPPDQETGSNTNYSTYISAYTSGTVSTQTEIVVRLNAKVGDVAIGTVLDAGLFEFAPSIKGKAMLLAENAVHFIPDEPLKAGQKYQAVFKLDKILDVPLQYASYSFDFATIEQNLKVTIDRQLLNASNQELAIVKGRVVTADNARFEDVKKTIEASVDDEALTIRWERISDVKFNFIIDSIQRKADERMVLIRWNGDPLNVKYVGSEEVSIPKLDDFKLVTVKVVNEQEQYVVLNFSEHLDADQDLKGLIRIENISSIKLRRNGNEVEVYPENRLSGDHFLLVDNSIRSKRKTTLVGDDIKREIQFVDIKPQIRFIKSGTILPDSKGLNVPFEAVSLRAVDVTVFKVFENNIVQHLQNNSWSGTYQLRKVGVPIIRKTIRLDDDKTIQLNNWNTFSLDLTELIEKDPGALYHLKVSFRKEFSTYLCNGNETEVVPELEFYNDHDENGLVYWQERDNWYNDYYYPEGYRWNQVDNPCHVSYYNSDRFISKNIYASNIGLTVKAEDNHQYHVFVTDMISAKPISGADISIVSFQKQEIASTKSDSRGMAEVDLRSKPHWLIATYKGQKAYLELDGWNSLSVSRFDVGGARVKEGLKAFIYGERGVWRPGDSIFLSMILEDKNHQLPAKHPITVEVVNPKGQIDQRFVVNNNVNGFYSLAFATSPDAITGRWQAKVSIGNVVFYKPLRIETVKPNRLKISLSFDGEIVDGSNGKIYGSLYSQWLHGATARNLDAVIDMKLSRIKTSFEGYSGFSFDNPAVRFYPDQQRVFDGSLDAEGKANFESALNSYYQSPGMLRAGFLTKVFEEAGDFSVDFQSVKVSCYDNYVGLRLPEGDRRGTLLTDEDHTIEIVSVDSDGNPIDLNKLEVKVFKVNWRWWWNAGDNDIADFFSRSITRPVFESLVSTKDGKASVDFQIKYPEWGRYFVQVKHGNAHSAGKTVYVDWPSDYNKADRKNPDAATMLMFSLDKEEYKVGETVKLSFPSGGTGQALISLEKGGKILQKHWVKAQTGNTEFEFEVTADMAPTVYAFISLMQPHEQTANDLPMRMYGVQPIKVVNDASILKPELDTPESIRPEQDYTVKIKEKDGKKMTYTLAVVDEGLLSLTRFKTPDPWSGFYAKEALSVMTWDIFDEVINAYGGNIEQMFAIGGGAEGDDEGDKKANRFKPVVEFIGPYTIDENETAEHQLKMPNYVGEVRIMLIAGNEGAYGTVARSVPVKQPLMVLGTLPRVLGPAEKVSLPITVFAMENSIQEVEVNVRTNDMLTVSGQATKSLTFDRPGDQIIDFNLEVEAKVGMAKVFIEVTSGSESATYEIELDVRNPNPAITDNYSLYLKPGETFEKTLQYIGMEGTNEGVVELSTIPSIDFGRRLKYLLRYPYGCAEQTVSAVFPQLYLDAVMETTPELDDMVATNIMAAINRIRLFQTSSGGFAFWPGNTIASEWATCYVSHFLLEAEKKGYAIPVDMKERFIKYLQRLPGNRDYYKYYEAYRLYTLALANNADLAAMNRFRERNDIDDLNLWRLAAAYALAGKEDIAKELTFDLGTEESDYWKYTYRYSYGSSIRNKAIILETMSLLNQREKGIRLLEEIADVLNSRRWLSTQSTAYSLIAISGFIGNDNTENRLLKGELKVNGQLTDFESQLTMKQFELNNTVDSLHIVLENTSNSDLYGTISLIGQPIDADDVKKEENLILEVNYYTLNGKRLDIRRIEQGTDFYCLAKVKHPGVRTDAYTDLALNQVFPSGWEIVNTRYMDGEESALDQYDFQDYRDDRVYTFFGMQERSAKHVKILLNATYQGKFYHPAIVGEAMYDNTIIAVEPGKWVEVVDAK